MQSIYNNYKAKCSIAIMLLSLAMTGCKKLVEVDPPVTSVTGASVYGADATASAVLTGLYFKISGGVFYSPGSGITTLSMYAALSADEFTLWSGVTNATQLAYYTNTLSTVTAGSEYWSPAYANIFTCNSAIEGLNGSAALTPAVKQQLLGEAKFMRAFFYFYLVNLYGDVPLIVSTDYKVNAALGRTPRAQVYQQIIDDLKEAQGLLSSDYLDATLLKVTSERVRPTKWAATALLARTYLYNGDYANAEAQASIIINNSPAYKLVSLNSTFGKNSNEAIWQLQPVTTGTITNTQDGYYFTVPAAGPNSTLVNGNPVYLNTRLLNSFEANDKRRTIGNWVNSVTVNGTTYYYPYKYKVSTGTSVSEYLMVLRVGEQLLIRAEARAQQNKITGPGSAEPDIDSIRVRAGLLGVTANTKDAMLAAIYHERQVELFTEWGHRWLDLKRTNAVDTVMGVVTPQKGGITWSTNQQLYPLPAGDLQKNPNLAQNNGY
jgi:hypothetical protein